MSRRRVLGRPVRAALTTGFLLVAASPAMAGGWWTYPQLDAEPMSPGERVTASATVTFASPQQGEAAGGTPYFAYLVRGVDQEALQEAMSQGEPEGWWSTPDETILLGRIQFGETDANLRRATVTFEVPDVETGAYSLMFCTRGCTEPLADVVPQAGVYVADPAGARLVRDGRETNRQLLRALDELQADLQRIERGTGGLDDRAAELDRRAAEIARTVDGVESSMGVLQGRIDELQNPPPLSWGWPSWMGWFVAGLALAAGRATRQQMKDGRPDTDLDDHGSAGSAREDERASAPEFITSL